MKKFLYLVQSKGALPEIYDRIPTERSDMILLTWKDRVEGAIHFPKSTWTQGRNRLLQEALDRQGDYLYYIFLDEDVLFTKGDWRTFEDALLKYEPAVATPYCPWYSPEKKPRLDLEAHTCGWFDAMYNAFHREIIEDRLILPYYDTFDGESWWYSQLFVIELVQELFPDHLLQVNTVWTDNAKHQEYPRQSDFAGKTRWFHREVMRPRSFAKKVLVKASNLWRRTPYRKPSKKISYRVPLAKRKRWLNLESEFWKKGLTPVPAGNE